MVSLFKFNTNNNVYVIAEVVEAGAGSEIEKEFEENINNILGDIESSELDEFVLNDFNLDFFDVGDFKDLIIKVLKGEYFEEYGGLFDAIKSFIKDEFSQLLNIFLVFIVVVLLFELFNNLCVDKYADMKKIVKVVFSLILVVLIMHLFKQVSNEIFDIVNKIFSFAKVIFPILLSLILMSGSVGTHSVYSSLSLFLLNAGSYIFTYFLMSIAISIFVLSLAGSIFSKRKFSRIIDIFKSIFKYVILIFFTIFGLFSSVNLITSSVKDGVSVRLTKYAVKNYIPLIGGYISQGFDFIRSCSIIIKNAFGVCGIFVLLFLVLKPVLICFIYLFLFKIISASVALIGNIEFSDLFNDASKTMSYFIAVIAGLFFIIFIFIYLLIISVSVI